MRPKAAASLCGPFAALATGLNVPVSRFATTVPPWSPAPTPTPATSPPIPAGRSPRPDASEFARRSGVRDGLAKLDQVVETVNNRRIDALQSAEPERQRGARSSRLARRHGHAAAGGCNGLAAGGRRRRHGSCVTSPDADTLYQVLAAFSNGEDRFAHRRPAQGFPAVCPVRVRSSRRHHDHRCPWREVKIYRGAAFGGQPEVTMSMSADFAHAFCTAGSILVSALTRRQVVAKGNVPRPEALRS